MDEFQPFQPMDAKLRVCVLFLLCSVKGSRFFCHLVFWVVFQGWVCIFIPCVFGNFRVCVYCLKKADGATNSPRNYFKTKAKRLAEIAALILTQHRGGPRFAVRRFCSKNERPLDALSLLGMRVTIVNGLVVRVYYVYVYIYMNINCMHSIYTVRFVIYCSCFISYRTFRYSNNFRIQALRAFKISSFSICNLKVRMILFHFEGALFFSKKPSV